jgi:hypothetical protein
MLDYPRRGLWLCRRWWWYVWAAVRGRERARGLGSQQHPQQHQSPPSLPPFLLFTSCALRGTCSSSAKPSSPFLVPSRDDDDDLHTLAPFDNDARAARRRRDEDGAPRWDHSTRRFATPSPPLSPAPGARARAPRPHTPQNAYAAASATLKTASRALGRLARCPVRDKFSSGARSRAARKKPKPARGAPTPTLCAPVSLSFCPPST